MICGACGCKTTSEDAFCMECGAKTEEKIARPFPTHHLRKPFDKGTTEQNWKPIDAIIDVFNDLPPLSTTRTLYKKGKPRRPPKKIDPIQDCVLGKQSMAESLKTLWQRIKDWWNKPGPISVLDELIVSAKNTKRDISRIIEVPNNLPAYELERLKHEFKKLQENPHDAVIISTPREHGKTEQLAKMMAEQFEKNPELREKALEIVGKPSRSERTPATKGSIYK